MHTLIVYAHPYENSFSHAQLEAVCRRLAYEGHDYEVIDLYKDGFNPVLSKEELKIYFSGQSLDPLVRRYQDTLLSCQHLVMIFPIWWSEAPAIIKGWLDKVMLNETIWTINKEGKLIGKLSNIQSLVVYTTSASPTKDTVEECGDAIRKCLIDGTMWQLNIAGRLEAGYKDLGDCAIWQNFGMLSSSDEKERIDYLKGLEGLK